MIVPLAFTFPASVNAPELSPIGGNVTCLISTAVGSMNSPPNAFTSDAGCC